MALNQCTRGLILLVLLATMPSLTLAQQPPEQKKKREIKHYTFDNSDFIRATLGQIHAQYFVGEPINVPITISNHTKYPITVTIGFHPRGTLKVIIRPQGKRSKKFVGPYHAGTYAPTDYGFSPADELTYQCLLWSDYDDPTGLAFPEPGKYTVDIKLGIQVPEGNFQGELNAGTFEVTIVPTPPKFAPLVAMLKKDRAVIDLELRRTSAAWGEALPKLIEQYSPSPFTPYLCYAEAIYELNVWARDKSNRKALDASLKYFIYTTKSTSAYKLDSYLELLSLLDTLGLSKQAEMISREILQVMPRNRLGHMGMHPLIKKYLINTTEMDPATYWVLFQ